MAEAHFRDLSNLVPGTGLLALHPSASIFVFLSLEVRTEGTAEGRELRDLRGRSRMSNYVAAALEMRGVEGAELELNMALGIGANRFPLEMLAPAEERANTTAETVTRPRSWLDRIFADTAAMRVGVGMVAVEPGVSSHPLTTAGAAFGMKEKEVAVGDTAWTVGVTEAKPKRGGVRAVFTLEDAARLPGLEDALLRDLRMALTEGVDRAIFIGADGGSNNTADITGLTTAAITEVTLTQANKIKADKVLQAFLGMVDGIHAGGLEDLRIITAVGAYTLWGGTIHNSAAENQTVAQFLTASGLSYGGRGDIEDATANGDFGAFIGRGRNIDGAACACVWSAGELIRDPYSGASKGRSR